MIYRIYFTTISLFFDNKYTKYKIKKHVYMVIKKATVLNFGKEIIFYIYL